MEPGKPIWNSILLTNILLSSFPSFIYELLVTYWVSAKAVALGFNTACQVIIPLVIVILAPCYQKYFEYSSWNPLGQPETSTLCLLIVMTPTLQIPTQHNQRFLSLDIALLANLKNIVQSSTWDVIFYGGYWQAKQFIWEKTERISAE